MGNHMVKIKGNNENKFCKDSNIKLSKEAPVYKDVCLSPRKMNYNDPNQNLTHTERTNPLERADRIHENELKKLYGDKEMYMNREAEDSSRPYNAMHKGKFLGKKEGC